MSQNEPYVCITRSSSGVKQSRPFAKKAAALAFGKKHGYKTLAQKKRGHAGLTIVQEIPDSPRSRKKVTIQKSSWFGKG